ncbi:MAG: RecQ family ATP-dependent DNA helicase [Armatimonadetes bacterium]|nr:RecQ family ATP-dependent DNA helicase [Armatimonadota bacterium]
MYLRGALQDNSKYFRDGQWEAIESVVTHKEKLLVVQRTGWGKSIVYFLATKLLREAGAGPTLLVSPLLSLIRNQIEAARRIGITAQSIDSTNTQDWDEIKARVLAGDLDVLLVSPERLANESFVKEVLSKITSSVGMFVVDEAHCISDWGHDFRPDYLRIARILRALPPNTPALATTATANDRVVEDVVSQLGSELKVIRGPLVRQSLRLQNIMMPNQAARMAWLAEYVPKMKGSGIVYTLTVRDAVKLTEWLRCKGIDACAYHSGGNISNDEKKTLEQKLLNNEIKTLVATVALGMGFDKSDLDFVIHFQRPASVVHYYQQVGRAGRAVERAYGILLGSSEDDDIADYFIEHAFPPTIHISNVIAAIENAPDGLTKCQLLQQVNMPARELDKVFTMLSVQQPSPIVNQGGKYVRTATPFAIDSQKITRLKSVKRAEQKRMQDYMQTTGCLMEFLSRELDDPHASKCGMCACCVGAPLLPPDYDKALAAEASAFLRRSEIVIEPRKQWPSQKSDDRYKGKIPDNLRAESGRALCMWGDAGWGDLVKRGKQEEEHFSDELVDAAVDMIPKRWNPQPPPAWVTCVPSMNREVRVPDFAKRVASVLGIPFRPCVVKVQHTQPQKLMQNSNRQLNNIKDAFTIYKKLVLPYPVLLIDDIVDSRWTFTVITALLRDSGSGDVLPLALAKTLIGSL